MLQSWELELIADITARFHNGLAWALRQSFKKHNKRLFSKIENLTKWSMVSTNVLIQVATGFIYHFPSTEFVDRILTRSHEEEGCCMVGWGSICCFLQMMLSWWHYWSLTFTPYWIRSQQCVKRLGWGSAPLNLSPWFLTGNWWTVHSEQGMSPYSKWRVSNISGSWSRVGVLWSRRLAEDLMQQEQFCIHFTTLLWQNESWADRQSSQSTGQSLFLP